MLAVPESVINDEMNIIEGNLLGLMCIAFQNLGTTPSMLL